jgi:phospholipase C
MNTFAFESGEGKTHQFITQNAVEILNSDKNDNLVSTINNYESILMEYSDWPDSYETDLYTYLGHFYDPDTGKNYLGGTSTTALTRFIEHTNNALNDYETDEEEAFKSIGKALHYLQDMHVPHHAANEIAGLSNHTEYESWITDHQNEFIVTTSQKYDYLSDNILSDFEGYSSEILIDSAVNAKSNIELALSSSESDMFEAAQNTLPRSQEIVAAYLYNFMLNQNQD